MLFFQGSDAFTAFRKHKLIQKIQEGMNNDLRLDELRAEDVFFADVVGDLSEVEQQRLESLLPNAKSQRLTKEADHLVIWVLPRIGTISPWSSKATEIAKNCELLNVQRLERGVCFQFSNVNPSNCDAAFLKRLATLVHDPLTESVLFATEDLPKIFEQHEPNPVITIKPVSIDTVQLAPVKGVVGRFATWVGLVKHQQPDLGNALELANESMGLALSKNEVAYLNQSYAKLKRYPTDAELMMFGQVNSEHCRHKVFNAKWTIEGKPQAMTLFGMIRNTQKLHPENVYVAYKDNAAVLKGSRAQCLIANPETQSYSVYEENASIVLKVETHNHPTAISPFSGAATGSGGEIRDEAATGRGAKPKAGVCGFSVSHLRIPEFQQPWEIDLGKPAHMATPLEIMLEAPIGAASFNNEFGRPNIAGYFRTFEMRVPSDYGDMLRGYHKPIMIAGGIGTIRDNNIEKKSIPAGAKLIVLGGPAMPIGLGGGSASSLGSGESTEALDFASVQRSNPEMERRCQEVINTCVAMGEKNPILSVHDVGAGGLSNAMPELVHACGRGAQIQLRSILNDAPGMSPMEIWCNEAQERFVLAIKENAVSTFKKVAERERCCYAIVGEATPKPRLTVNDTTFNNNPIDLPLNVLFEDMPPMEVDAERYESTHPSFAYESIDLGNAVKRVLQFPAVGSKSFLITIGDRSVGGMVARDQFVGPWQVPVSDVGVTTTDYFGYSGEAIAMGERAPIALLHPAASARMAVGEAIMNIAAAPIESLGNISLSANWMAAADYVGEAAGLYDAVQTIGMELCPALGISIPVGKDSLSMRASWEKNGERHTVASPLSLVITAAGAVTDVRKTLTPQLRTDAGETQLLLIDLGKGIHSLGGSVLAQTYQMLGQRPADLDDPQVLKHCFEAIQYCNQAGLLLAYHDRSDGGLLATVCEMSFAGHVGVRIDLSDTADDVIPVLFNEELGAVLQVRAHDLPKVLNVLERYGLKDDAHVIGALADDDHITIVSEGREHFRDSRVNLQRLWSETSYRMQALRDNEACAQEEYDRLLDENDPGLQAKLSFNLQEKAKTPAIHLNERPRVAILREQGVNGQLEMAAAFHRAGFESVDVHMSELISGERTLSGFVGLAACGGFSYGDVLGAGRGWAQSILMHSKVRDEFAAFFERSNTFSLGVCNGCQMLSQLKVIIPGAEHWPTFHRNHSEQFEARLSMVKIEKTPSIFLADMAESYLPVVVSHGEGRAVFSSASDMQKCQRQDLIGLRYVDNHLQTTETYPANPNGSAQGITGLTTADGRATILMPHPERIFRSVQMSWHPDDWGEESPWMQFFRNARNWVG